MIEARFGRAGRFMTDAALFLLMPAVIAGCLGIIYVGAVKPMLELYDKVPELADLIISWVVVVSVAFVAVWAVTYIAGKRLNGGARRNRGATKEERIWQLEQELDELRSDGG